MQVDPTVINNITMTTEKGVAGRTDYASWDKVTRDLVEQTEQEEQHEEQQEKAKLGLDGKYARSAAEAEEREKFAKVKKTKKTLEKFKKRETMLVQSFSNVFDTNGTHVVEETKHDGNIFRITRDMVDAGKRVVSIQDTTGTSITNSTIVLTQDLSHLESKMPTNEKAKNYQDDAENDIVVPEQQQQKERSIYGLIKVFLSNLQNVTVLVKCKIITGTIELHNCENVTIKIEKEATVATIQADLSNNINIQFHDAPSGKNIPGQKNQLYWGDDADDRIFHAGITNMHIQIYRDGYLEMETITDYIKDGAIAIGNASEKEFQFVTSVINGELITEKVVRNATNKNVRAMTDRELQKEKEKRTKAANMAIAMAEDMIQVKDKDGNVLVKKNDNVVDETVTKDNEEEVIEEIYTTHTKEQIDEIIKECDILKQRGNEAFGAGEYGQAILHYSLCIDKAMELPQDASTSTKPFFAIDVVYSNRSAAFLKLGQHEKAEVDATKALEINPNNIKALFRKGLALHALQQYMDAIPYLSSAHKIEPNNKQIKQALQFCEIRIEQERRKRMEG